MQRTKKKLTVESIRRAKGGVSVRSGLKAGRKRPGRSGYGDVIYTS